MIIGDIISQIRLNKKLNQYANVKIEGVAISGIGIEFHIETDGAKMPRMTIEDLATQMTSDFKKVNGRLNVIETDIRELKKDVKAMKDTPTMKKELSLSK